MNLIPKSLAGMNDITDEVIATDLLNTAKTGVKNYAFAITKAATPKVREVLHGQFMKAVEMHEEIANYMISRGWYQPDEANVQIQLDLQTSPGVRNSASSITPFAGITTKLSWSQGPKRRL